MNYKIRGGDVSLYVYTFFVCLSVYIRNPPHNPTTLPKTLYHYVFYSLCCGIIIILSFFFLSAPNDFVNISAKLKSVPTLKGIIIEAATLSLTL